MTTVTIAHSPDADDAFMFYALTERKVGTLGIRYKHTLQDIQTLNEWAKEGRYDVTALSVHAYAYVADQYAILRSGASMGEADYGPMVVARDSWIGNRDAIEQLRKTVIAVPGKMTSAYLLLQLALNESRDTNHESPIETVVMPFDKILPAVRDGKIEAGLLIHEGQLTYEAEGLVSVLALNRWWHEKHELPTPLGFNGIRHTLDLSLKQTIARDLCASIKYAIKHRKEATAYAAQYAPDLAPELIDQFVGMYVNQRTVSMGDEERRATRLLLEEAVAAKLIPAMPEMMWVG